MSAYATTVWARTLIEALAGAGVREVSIAPGSRSTPLVMAAARHPRLRVRVHLDERSASFFALGVGKATGDPAVVVTTSGTAAANLLPAVVEASWSSTPLILLTADRPPRLRGADANQAIDQLRLYGDYVRAFHDLAVPALDDRALLHLEAVAARAVADALGEPAGPVHLNAPFEKPLEPPEEEPTEAREGAARAGGEDVGGGDRGSGGRAGPGLRVSRRTSAPDEIEVGRLAERLADARRGVLVVGPVPDPDVVGDRAVRLAGRAGVPLLADPLSGARWRDHEGALVVGGYDLYLSAPEVRGALAPDFVVRVGQAPTSRALGAWLEDHRSVPQVVVDPGYRWKDHSVTAREYVRADPARTIQALATRFEVASGSDRAVREAGGGAGEADREPHGRRASESARTDWRARWQRCEEVVRRVLEGGSDFGPGLEGAVVAAVVRALRPGTELFVSSSMPVRDLDAFGTPRSVQPPVLARGNRGASGIDGIVSTALGVAAGSAARVVAVLGDLAFYHDMNGLLATREEGVEVVFVVIHNDGGGIFHMLPVAEHEPWFTPYFATPHGLDFRHAAEMYGLPYVRLEGDRDVGDLLREVVAGGGSRVVEVRTDRESNRRLRQAVVDRVAAAVAEELS